MSGLEKGPLAREYGLVGLAGPEIHAQPIEEVSVTEDQLTAIKNEGIFGATANSLVPQSIVTASEARAAIVAAFEQSGDSVSPNALQDAFGIIPCQEGGAQ